MNTSEKKNPFFKIKLGPVNFEWKNMHWVWEVSCKLPTGGVGVMYIWLPIMTCCICKGKETTRFLYFLYTWCNLRCPWSLLLYICIFSVKFRQVSHCHWNSSSLMLFSTQWQPEYTTFLQSVVVSVYQYKHSCSTAMASPCINYPSCQLRWKDTAPDKARPHSLISHWPFFTPPDVETPFSKQSNETPRWMLPQTPS